ATPCGLPFVLGIAAIAGLLVIYNLVSKRIGVWKGIFVAVLVTSLYPLAWTLTTPAQTPRLPVLFIHPVWLFLSCLGYEMLKDIRDVKGDQTISGGAHARRQGRRFLLAARVVLVAGSIVTLLPYFLGYCRQVYLAASIGAVILALGSTRRRPAAAIRYIYAEIFLITAGSLADLLVFGP
ncbi:MAG: UbiA family prenyltransferase, partial [Sedimentisphaerales bacterium]|nr:UbiA family prenyltransferase [Sedimentisphaerales bacterium]